MPINSLAGTRPVSPGLVRLPRLALTAAAPDGIGDRPLSSPKISLLITPSVTFSAGGVYPSLSSGVKAAGGGRVTTVVYAGCDLRNPQALAPSLAC
jgi:hypothetical protein